MAKLDKEPSTASITIYLSAVIDDYILSQNPNRSEWLRDASREFLKFINNNIVPDFDINSEMERHKIVSISKPSKAILDVIFYLVHGKGLMFSRSEFYRISIFYKMIMDTIKRTSQEQLAEAQADPNTVNVPISVDAEGNHEFKTYQILRKLDF